MSRHFARRGWWRCLRGFQGMWAFGGSRRRVAGKIEMLKLWQEAGLPELPKDKGDNANDRDEEPGDGG